MLFDPRDLHPDYTPEEIEKLFFLRSDLSDLSAKDKEVLLAKVNSLGLKDIRLYTVYLLLCVMHEAREVHQPRFLKEVFLPWHELRQKTKAHFERIGEELSRIDKFTPGSVKEAAHFTNIYRNIVSDLFDPYLTLVVACFQFKVGNFTSLDDADLGQGERNKFEYLTARVKEVDTRTPNFLSGYDPLVRNAISHSGARGVTYGLDRVVFKNIKRGTPPVVDTVTWSFDELQHRVLQLIECLQSIEVAAEVFGLDCTESIKSDFDTFSQFVLHAVPHERRAELRDRHGETAVKIRESGKLTSEQRREALSQVLFYNCGVRGMPCRGVRFSSGEFAILVEVPAVAIDLNDDEQLLGRVSELPRYAILARSVFGEMCEAVHVVETDETRHKSQLAVLLRGKDLDEYIEERAGLVDLLNDSKWTLEGQPLGIQVDFEAVEQAEQANAKEPFPRKPRASS
jgi:hypothetical protein